MTEPEGSSLLMTTKRIETLVDGIFAIAMTLLVLNLAVPKIDGLLTSVAFQHSLYSILPNFYAFVLSFILLAMFWNINHRIFNQIKLVDEALLWINAIWLLFIVMVPFSTSLTGQYGQFPLSHIVFNLNMLGIALFLYLNWQYATWKDFIYENVDPAKITSTKRILLAFILISLLALAAVFISPRWSGIVYLLILPVEKLMERRIGKNKGTNL